MLRTVKHDTIVEIFQVPFVTYVQYADSSPFSN